MKNATLLFAILLLSVFLSAQNNWKKYDSNNGLFSNEIVKMIIADDSSIWMATPDGISIANGDIISNHFHLTGVTTNSKIVDMVLTDSGAWVRTEFEISFFNGNSYTIFNESKGFIHSKVYDFTVDLNGVLWIAGDSGVSKYDGHQFTNWVGRRAKSIEANGINNIYILKYDFVDNINLPPHLSWVEIFDGTQWFTDTLTHFNFDRIDDAKLKRLNDGSLIILGRNMLHFNKITSSFTIQQIKFTQPEAYIHSTSSQDIEIDNDGNYWVLLSGFYRSLFKIENNNLKAFLPHVGQISNISINVGKIGFAGNLGAYVSSEYLSIPHLKDSLPINNIGVSVDFQNSILRNNMAGFEFPKGSNLNNIYESYFAISAKKINQQNFEEINSSNSVLKLGPKSNSSFPDKNYLVKVRKADIFFHKNNFNLSNYTMPQGIKEWPAQGDTSIGMAMDLAPFVDVNANGCYDPEKGDYPSIKGDEALYWINHTPNGFEFHSMLYAYYDTINQDINNSLFLNYTIINRSNYVYDSMKIGLFIDPDLGDAHDDYLGCDSLTNSFYCYNGDNFDSNFHLATGKGNKIPAIGVRFLSDRMEGFLSVTNIDFRVHQNLNSRWANGSPVTYGGNGQGTISNGNIRTNYMFTGDPVNNTGWTEGNPGNGISSILPGDRKGIANIPYTSLAPQERKSIDLVFGVGYDTSLTSYLQNINDLKRVLNYAKQVYDSSLNSTGILANNIDCIDTVISVREFNKPISFDIYPNPAQNEIAIKSKNTIQEISLFDIRGTLVFRKQISEAKQTSIELNSELSNGIYFVRILLDGSIQNRKLLIQR